MNRSSRIAALLLTLGLLGSAAVAATPLRPATTPLTPLAATPLRPAMTSLTPLATGALSTRTPIKHVIIIVMENRSLDNLFHNFPGADTASVGRGHNGQSITLSPTPFEGLCDPDHSHEAWIKDYNAGRMNGFDTTPASCIGASPAPDYPYGYVPAVETAPYVNLAKQFRSCSQIV